VVGPLERVFYSGPGLEKFGLWDNDLWQKVYEDDQTAVYQVLE